MLMNNKEYFETIESIKNEIKSAQYKAAVSVNRELIMLYYNIGKVPSVDKSTQARKACFGTLLRSRRLYYIQ